MVTRTQLVVRAFGVADRWRFPLRVPLRVTILVPKRVTIVVPVRVRGFRFRMV